MGKDFSTRRGLVALVNKRRRLLNYLVREDVNRYSALVSALGIRHKAPGRVESREEKYANFPKKKKTTISDIICYFNTMAGANLFVMYNYWGYRFCLPLWDDWDTVKNGMKKTFRW